MSNGRGGLTVPKTGQRASNPEARNFYAEDPAPVPVGPGTAPIPFVTGPLMLGPGTYIVTFNCHADGSGVTAPGAAIGVSGAPLPPSFRFFSAAPAQNVTVQSQVIVPAGPPLPIEAISLGTAVPTTFLERSISAVRVTP